VHEKGARAAVDVGEGVLYLSSGGQHFGNLFVVSLDQLDEVVVLDEFLGELELADKAGIGLAENGVSVSGNNLAGGHGVSHKLTDILTGPSFSVLLLKTEQVSETLLVGEAVERASKTVHTSRE